MLLLHTKLRIAIVAGAVTIRLRISAVDKVVHKYLEFDTSASDSPFMVMLALMFFSVMLAISVLTSMSYELALAPRRSVTSCSSILILPIKSISPERRSLKTGLSLIEMVVWCSKRVFCVILYR